MILGLWKITPVLKPQIKRTLLPMGKNAVGVLACSSPGESRTCVDAVDDEVCDSNSYEVISRADLKMNGGSITTNGINSYGAYANGKKAYINLDYVVLETVADGSYAVAIRQGNIDIKSSITTNGTKAPIAKIYNGRELFFSNVTSESTETPTPVLRPEAGSYVANLAAANTLFVMRLNDRADETRYIDPVTEQERSSRFWLRQIGGHNAWRDSNGQLRTTSAQAIWMGVDHNVHTEANGSRIENDANNNIQTRLGFHTFIRTQEKNSGPHGDDFEPFVEMNGIHNSKDFAVSINGVKVEQAGARNLGEIKHGVNGNLNPAASVWGNVGVQLGDNGYNDNAMMVGLKYKF